MPSDYLDAEQSDLHVPAVPPGFMREVVLEQCYSQPLAPRSRTVYYHYVETVLNPSPGSHVVLRTALLTEDTVEGFLRSPKGLREVNEAGLQHANFAFGDAVARGLPSTAPAQSTVGAMTGAGTVQVAINRVGSPWPPPAPSPPTAAPPPPCGSSSAAPPPPPPVTAPPAPSPATPPLSLGSSLSFPALKCAGCKRWHHVPEEVFHKVRCPIEHTQHPHLLTVRRRLYRMC